MSGPPGRRAVLTYADANERHSCARPSGTFIDDPTLRRVPVRGLWVAVGVRNARFQFKPAFSNAARIETATMRHRLSAHFADPRWRAAPSAGVAASGNKPDQGSGGSARGTAYPRSAIGCEYQAKVKHSVGRVLSCLIGQSVAPELIL